MLSYNETRSDELKNWVFSEVEFQPLALGKAEAVMSLGNGYMGLRSAAAEPYIGEAEPYCTSDLSRSPLIQRPVTITASLSVINMEESPPIVSCWTA
ncbi:hypothetical protein AWM70_20615 [Paenibacillus yonginensis]|uniref:Glycoside hydrolase family 65 N-terminal domain-containing protein n=1 Tax=Paenibacillus yonginensis TaxID=1462996 RepID=A0A1B1N5M5_9BACL|nr:hypothetical protein AWM70_20615 [Paenibacillus yonginensis]